MKMKQNTKQSPIVFYNSKISQKILKGRKDRELAEYLCRNYEELESEDLGHF